eukprot:4894815-Prymnesium_polylepis.1
MEVEVGTEAPRKCLAARRHPSGSTPNSKPAATTASFPWVLAVASRRPAAARQTGGSWQDNLLLALPPH